MDFSGEQAQRLRLCDGLGAAMDAQADVEIVDVRLDGTQGDNELLGDLLIGFAGGDGAQDKNFALAQMNAS